MKVADTIAAKLKTGLEPSFLDVQDVSHQHAGHGGWREGGGTHFTVTIKASIFNGKSRVQQHRMVMTCSQMSWRMACMHWSCIYLVMRPNPRQSHKQHSCWQDC